MLPVRLILVLCVIASASASSRVGLRMGGKACEANPHYCKNGGVCYTQNIVTPAPLPMVTKPVEVPVCGCQPTHVGPQCETPITVAPTLPPTTQRPVPVCTTPRPTLPPTTPRPVPVCTTPATTTTTTTTTPRPVPVCTTPRPTLPPTTFGYGK